MNTEMPKKSKFDILEEIMISFQNDYETDNAQTHLVKTYKERKERLIQLQEEEYELQANVIDDAHDLGFVIRMQNPTWLCHSLYRQLYL